MLQPIQPLTQMSASELIAVSVCSTTTSISLPSPSAFYSTSRSLSKTFWVSTWIPNLRLLECSLPPGGSFHPAPVSTNHLASTFKWASQSSSSSNLRALLPPGSSFHQDFRTLLSTEPHRPTWTRSIIGASKIYLKKKKLFWGACSMNRPPLTT